MFKMVDFKPALNLQLNDIVRIDDEYVQVDFIDDPTRQVRSEGELILRYMPIDRITSLDSEDLEDIRLNRHLKVAIYRWDATV